jgi:hypothetical protein
MTPCSAQMAVVWHLKLQASIFTHLTSFRIYQLLDWIQRLRSIQWILELTTIERWMLTWTIDHWLWTNTWVLSSEALFRGAQIGMVINAQAHILNASNSALYAVCPRNQDIDVISQEFDADHAEGTPEGTQEAFGSGSRLCCWVRWSILTSSSRPSHKPFRRDSLWVRGSCWSDSLLDSWCGFSVTDRIWSRTSADLSLLGNRQPHASVCMPHWAGHTVRGLAEPTFAEKPL